MAWAHGRSAGAFALSLLLMGGAMVVLPMLLQVMSKEGTRDELLVLSGNPAWLARTHTSVRALRSSVPLRAERANGDRWKTSLRTLRARY